MTVNIDGLNLYVSDFEKKFVTRLKASGDVAYKYNNRLLNGPYSMYMYVDLKGTIIVCSRGSYTPVHVVTATGEQRKVLPTSEITKPMCVDFRPSDGTLVFGTSDSAYLTVFQIKLDQERIVRSIRFSIQLWQYLTPILLSLNNWYIWEPVLENEQLKGIILTSLLQANI